MRPIDKGGSPYTSIANYSEAMPHLISAIGAYCSYCEMCIQHAPEVEHIVAKDSGGDKTNWDNLLLGCKYCNSRKGTIIGDFKKDRWLWPDKDNTFLAFTYINAIPKVNEVYLQSLRNDSFTKASNIFNDLKLDNIPQTVADKDRRFDSRKTALNKAKHSYDFWVKALDTPLRDEVIISILDVATSTGFFSIWMLIFEQEPIILNALIKAFVGTDINCFDDEGKPTSRNGGYV